MGEEALKGFDEIVEKFAEKIKSDELDKLVISAKKGKDVLNLADTRFEDGFFYIK